MFTNKSIYMPANNTSQRGFWPKVLCRLWYNCWTRQSSLITMCHLEQTSKQIVQLSSMWGYTHRYAHKLNTRMIDKNCSEHNCHADPIRLSASIRKPYRSKQILQKWTTPWPQAHNIILAVNRPCLLCSNKPTWHRTWAQTQGTPVVEQTE